MPYIEVNTEVFVEAAEFTDDELIEELETRGYNVTGDDETDSTGLLDKLYNLKRANDPKFDKVFADYIYAKLGRVL